MDPELVWTSYWRTYEECIRSGWFHFVGHPDLPKKFGFRPGGDLRRFYEPAIQALVDTGIAYEVNTAGLRKDCRELYPAFDFMQMACAAGVPVLINSDAHAPGELGAGFEEALRCVRAAGYSEVVRFHRGQRSSVALPVHS
jgi:histidinol-phosphatase (PHP family)